MEGLECQPEKCRSCHGQKGALSPKILEFGSIWPGNEPTGATSEVSLSWA